MARHVPTPCFSVVVCGVRLVPLLVVLLLLCRSMALTVTRTVTLKVPVMERVGVIHAILQFPHERSHIHLRMHNMYHGEWRCW